MSGEEPIIRDNVNEFSYEDQDHEIYESVEPSNQSQFTSSSL